MESKKRFYSLLLLIFLLALSVSCGGGQNGASKEAEPQQTTGPVYTPTGDEGTVAGKVAFEGTPPANPKLNMDADAVCARKHTGTVTAEEVLVSDGKLQNVFVYIKDGLGNKSFAVPQQEVVLDQNGCMYVPHVLGIQRNQNLKVTTSDDTTHNIHPLPKKNLEWNVNQPPKADPIIRKFNQEEVMIPVKCNQHPWMKAYIGVLSHPFYAVTGKDGSFELKGVPPGEYTIGAWHEKYGEKTQKITVGAKESKTVDFTFKADEAPASPPLGAPLILPSLQSAGGHSEHGKH